MARKPTRKKSKTDLCFHSGEEVDSLRRLIENLRDYDRHIIEKLSKKLKAKFLQDLTTPDGREWYTGLELAVGGARLAVLFPWTKDEKKEYPISVYVDRKITVNQIQKTLETVAKAYIRLNYARPRNKNP